MAYRNYGPSTGFIVDSTSTSDFATIQSAITAAAASIAAGQVSAATIFIKPGTYTENPALSAGVNLTAFDCDALTPNVIISGKCTFSSAGTVSISGIQLQTNADFALSVTGSAASIVNLNQCNIVAQSTNTAINFTTSNASATINILYCKGNISGGTAIFFNNSSTGSINFGYTSISNTGNSVTANTSSAGNVGFSWSNFQGVIITSSTSFFASSYSGISNSVSGTATLTLGGSAVNQFLYNTSIFGNGTAPLVVNCVLVTNRIDVHSDQNTPITGSGTFTYTDIDLQGPGSVIGNPILISTTNTNSTGMSGPWIPTLTGGTVAGTTTYNVRSGIWTRYNNLVYIEGNINIASATGTGDAVIGALPFVVKNISNYAPSGVVTMSGAGWTWPTGGTSLTIQPTANTQTSLLVTSGSAKSPQNMQMTNAAMAIAFGCWYQVN